MKKTFNLFLIATTALFVSCMQVDGTLSLKKDTKFIKAKINGRTVKSVTMPARKYPAKLEFTSKTKAFLKIANINSKGDDLSVQFNIPRNKSLPNTTGSFFLSSNEIGQSFDLSGDVTSRVSRSATQRTRESCTYYDYERKCRPVCKQVCMKRQNGRVDCHDNCRNTCSNEPVAKRGMQDISFHTLTENRSYEIELLMPNSNIKAAIFDGVYRNSSRVTEHEGVCQRSRF